MNKFNINEQATQAGASGIKTNMMRPLTAGTEQTVLNDGKAQDNSFNWDFLDKVGTTLSNAVVPALTNWINLKTGVADTPASMNTTRGSLSDQPSAGQQPTKELSFYAKNRTPILIGGGLVLAAALYKYVKG